VVTQQALERFKRANIKVVCPKGEVSDLIAAAMADWRMTKELLDQLNSHILELLRRVRNDKNYAELVRYVYWNFPEMPVDALSRAVVGTTGVKKLHRQYILPVKNGLRCRSCAAELESDKRDTLHAAHLAHDRAMRGEPHYLDVKLLVCPKCWQEVQRKTDLEQEARTEAWHAETRARIEQERRAAEQKRRSQWN
jgi:hypothetical protein